MTDNRNIPRSPVRGGELYKAARREITARRPKPISMPEPQSEEVFKVTFVATKEKGVSMDNEKNLVIDLIFNPNEGKLRLRPQETQLLLAYYAELLQEITDEEQVIIEEEKAKQEQEDISCK